MIHCRPDGRFAVPKSSAIAVRCGVSAIRRPARTGVAGENNGDLSSSGAG
jgi:hypothetical protein